MEEKDSRKNDDKQLTNIQAQILHRDTQEYNEVERQKLIDKKERYHEHSQEILQQIAYKQSISVPKMSEMEMQFNKPLPELVHNTLQNRDKNASLAAEDE